MNLTGEDHYDVLVLGTGLSGLSTAYHLNQEKGLKLGLISSPQRVSESSKLCSVMMGGLQDNITRTVHQWGEEKARELWLFAKESFDYTHSLASQLGVESSSGDRFRLTSQEDEVVELKLGAKLFQECHFDALYKERKNFKNEDFGKDVKAALVERGSGRCLDTQGLLEAFELALGPLTSKILDEVISFSEEDNGVTVRLISGKKIKTKMLVLCAHTGLRTLLPALGEALVPYQEETHKVKFKSEKKDLKGLTFSFFHGHIWGSFIGNQELQIGGARFLRKNAGIGFEKEEFNSSIKKYLLDSLGDYFPFLTDLVVEDSFCGIGLRSQDEVPLIGSVPGFHKVLMASGFMGQGTSFGVYSGLVLKDLVLTGKSFRLPNFILPDRLRKF